ncbi:MAG: trigger factor [Dorea sp.]
MKKRVVLSVITLGAALMMTGCMSDGASNDYITISKYEGVEVPAVEGLSEITEQSIDNNIENVREGFAEYNEVDRKIKDDDVVVLDYVTYVNGKEVESGSGENYQLTVGNNSLYDGFDENLIGRKPGDTFSLNNTFEDSYSDEALAGQDALLKITIQKVFEKELPDLTDEFVQTISQESETVEEYREEMRKVLEESNKEYVKTELIETVWEAVLENTEVTEYPEEDLNAAVQEFYDYYQKGADYYEMDFADFLEQKQGVTEEEFEEAVTEQAKANVKEDLVVALIAEKEKIELTDEEYTAAQEELAEEMSYESVEKMIEDATEEAVRKYIMRDAVKEWLVENCIQVKE